MRHDTALLLLQPEHGSVLKNKPSDLLLKSPYFGHKLGQKKSTHGTC